MDCKFRKSTGILSWLAPMIIGFSPSALAETSQTDALNIHSVISAAAKDNPSYCTTVDDSFVPFPVPRGGMASYKVFTRQASLNLFDFVLSYNPPIGHAIDFRLNYNYLESQQDNKLECSGFGSGWTLNWVSSLRPVQDGVLVNVLGGGTEFYEANSSKGLPTYKHNMISHALLEAMPDGTFQRSLPDGSIEIFGISDKASRRYLTELRDPAGNAVKVGYDQWYRVQTVTDAIGQQSRIKHLSDVPGHRSFFKIASITDPFGRQAKFAYDQAGRLVSSTDVLGLTSRFSYSSPTSAAVVTLSTPYGETKFKQYVPKNSPPGSLGLHVSHPDGTSTTTEHWAGDKHETYQWNRRALELYPDDPDNGIHSHCTVTKWLTSAASGRELPVKASVKAPLESEITYSYNGLSAHGFNGDSNLPNEISRNVFVKTADGSFTTAKQRYLFQYNRFGHILQQEDPIGRKVRFRYAGNGIDLLEAYLCKDNGDELLARMDYDGKHNVILYLDASEMPTWYEYNQFGQVVKITNAKKKTWTYYYDGKGYLTAAANPLTVGENKSARFTYDSFGRLQRQTDVDGHTIVIEYDNADRPTQVRYEDGSKEEVKYERLDAVSFKDRLGRITKRTYDNVDRLVSIEDSLGRKVQYEWCQCGALRKLINPAGHATEWHHDLQGRIIQKLFANGTEVNYEYEKGGHRLLSRKDALNQVTKYTYNLDDTISEIQYENTVNPTSDLKLSWDDGLLRLKAASNNLGTITLNYNELRGSLTGCALLHSVFNTGIPNSEIVYDYDELGYISRRSINGKENDIRIKRDDAGRISSESNILGEFKFSYDDGLDGKTAGTERLAKLAYPNGLITAFQYIGTSGEERLKTIRSALSSNTTALAQFDYSYDPAGQITRWQQQIAGKINSALAISYDAAGQLTDATRDDSPATEIDSHHFTYDRASNRTSVKNRGRIHKSAYNNVNELISLADFDAAGSKPESSDKFTNDANGNLLSNGKNTYKWDAENRLIRIDYPGTGNYTTFEYNALGQFQNIVEVEDGKMVSRKQLIWCDSLICEERDSRDNAVCKLYSQGESANGKNLYFVRDHLGSIRQVLDGTGSIITNIDYDPFGQVRLAEGAFKPTLQYAGYYTHERSGLNLTLFRAYDSRIGRWLSRDPIGEFGSLGEPEWPVNNSAEELMAVNLYAYCNNSPILNYDPLGLQNNNNTGYKSNAGLIDNRFGGNNAGAGYGGGTANASNASAGFAGATGGLSGHWGGHAAAQTARGSGQPAPYWPAGSSSQHGTGVQNFGGNHGIQNYGGNASQGSQAPIVQNSFPSNPQLYKLPNGQTYIGEKGLPLLQDNKTKQIYQEVKGKGKVACYPFR